MPFPTPGDLPNPGIEPISLACLLAVGFFTTGPHGEPMIPQVANTINLNVSFKPWKMKQSSSYKKHKIRQSLGFSGGTEDKTSAFNAGDLGSIPGAGRSPGEGNGNPLQSSCLENSQSHTSEQLDFSDCEIIFLLPIKKSQANKSKEMVTYSFEINFFSKAKRLSVFASLQTDLNLGCVLFPLLQNNICTPP